MEPHITRTHTLMSPTVGSGVTSNALCVADYGTQTLSWQTSADTTGSLVVQGTLVNGFTAAIANADWSTMTTVAAQGVFAVPTAARWLRVLRPANESSSTIIFAGKY